MAKFEATFRRRYGDEIDEFTRVIESAAIDEAKETAEAACSDFDFCCPDDAESIGDADDLYAGESAPSEMSGWFVFRTKEIDPATPADDL